MNETSKLNKLTSFKNDEDSQEDIIQLKHEDGVSLLTYKSNNFEKEDPNENKTSLLERINNRRNKSIASTEKLKEMRNTAEPRERAQTENLKKMFVVKEKQNTVGKTKRSLFVLRPSVNLDDKQVTTKIDEEAENTSDHYIKTINYIATCQSCGSKFDGHSLQPLALPCGHFFCRQCIVTKFTLKGDYIVCPEDKNFVCRFNELKILRDLLPAESTDDVVN